MCLIKYEILLVKGNYYHGTFFFTVTVHRFDLRNVSSPLYIPIIRTVKILIIYTTYVYEIIHVLKFKRFNILTNKLNQYNL